jgi:hypothetical protein
MPKHEKIVGTGITAEKRTSYSGADMPDALRRFFANLNSARKQGGGDYGAVTLDLVRQCIEIVGDDEHGDHAEHSQKWFAAQILTHHRIIERAIAEEDPDTAARFAYLEGYLHAQAHLKGVWEPHALRGLDTVRAARAGNQAVHGTDDEKRARWQAIHEDWQAEKAKGTKKPALVVALRHGVSERQVYRTQSYLPKID